MKQIIIASGELSLVDDADFEKVSRFKWYASKPKHGIYASAYIDKKMVKMHRFILGITDRKQQIDHKDGNGLNNQRENLRLCTQSENSRNRAGYGHSKYKGVQKTNENRWQAVITVNKVRMRLGIFATEKEAAIVFNDAAIATGDPFYRLNKIH